MKISLWKGDAMKYALRSVAAVLCGALIGVVLSVATDAFLHALGLLPGPGSNQPASDTALLAATVYRTLYGVLGAWVAARIAPSRPMVHVTVLGALGFAASLFGAIFTWDKGPAFGPHWYPVALVVLALPTAWLGGWLYKPMDAPQP
jgi:hypothetical protein